MLFLLLLLLQLRAGSGLLLAASVSQQCRLQWLNTSAPTAVCSPNATRIDLTSRNLTGRLILTFAGNRSLDSRQQLHLALLDVSGNPGLTGVSIVSRSGGGTLLPSVQISRLDISGTAMAPVPGRLLNVTARLLSIGTLIANSTTYAEPLDLSKVADLFYRIRVHTFTFIGWPLSNGRIPANLTSHAANYCGSKHFRSLTIGRSRLLRELKGSPGDTLTVTDNIDLSGNGLCSVSNVAISASRIDLSDNQLVDLPGVAFQPGSICRAAVTGPPTLLLRRNRLRYAALDSLAAGSRTSGFAGLDLSGNEQLLPEVEAGKSTATNAAPPKPSSITVTDFLDLSSLGGHPRGLAALLARFSLSQSLTFNLSLADNWIPDLASAAALVADFTAIRGDNGTPAVPIHLDLSGNPLLVHLNLTDMPSRLLASLTVRRLPHLRAASVRVSNDALVLERLRRRDHKSDTASLADLWSRRVPLVLDAQPDRCCLAGDSELFCSFGGAASQSGGLFCNNSDESPFDQRHQPPPMQSPELPLLFTCVVLGSALLLGLMTGVAIFYARRRSRGRYAVYSVHSLQDKDQQQQQQEQQPHSPGSRLYLKAVTVSTVVPIERAATPV